MAATIDVVAVAILMTVVLTVELILDTRGNNSSSCSSNVRGISSKNDQYFVVCIIEFQACHCL